MNAPTVFEQLASAASRYVEENVIQFSPLDLDSIDRILSHHRNTNEHDRAAIISTFGAWLGQSLVEQGGEWVNRESSIAPRVQLGTRYYSPFDLVERILYSENDAASCKQLVACALAEFTAAQSAESLSARQASRQNQIAWQTLSKSQRFTSPELPKLSLDEATASLDPWLRRISVLGKRTLCLAAGGGTHAALLAMAGAQVTVLDFCDSLLDIDRRQAEQLALQIDCVSADMQDLSQIEDNSFDVVVQPVSSSYVFDLPNVYSQVARITAPGGWYLSQNKSPTALNMHRADGNASYWLQHVQSHTTRLLENEPPLGLKEPGTQEFAHSLSTILGRLCTAGFCIMAFDEPIHADAWASVNSVNHAAQFVPPYIKVLAQRGTPF